jgi:nitrate/nitrite transporter NarK
MFLVSRSSDRSKERRWHSAIPALVSALSLGAALMTSDKVGISLFFISVATAGMWMAYTVFWSIPSSYLKDRSAAGGIALINTIGIFGGFLSPTIVGWLRTASGSFRVSLMLMVGVMIVGAVLLASIRIPIISRGKENMG